MFCFLAFCNRMQMQFQRIDSKKGSLKQVSNTDIDHLITPQPETPLVRVPLAAEDSKKTLTDDSVINEKMLDIVRFNSPKKHL